MKDEFDITLEVAGKPYRIPVSRGDEQMEFLYREAAKRVQTCMVQYRQRFSISLEDAAVLSMVAIHLARDVVQLEGKNDAEPYAHKIQQLTDKLDEYLKRTD
jgi:cell division protein ZapA